MSVKVPTPAIVEVSGACTTESVPKWRSPFRILLALVARPGQRITREELRAEVWTEETFVDFEHGLNAAVNKLRRALGDAAEKPRYIETYPGRG